MASGRPVGVGIDDVDVSKMSPAIRAQLAAHGVNPEAAAAAPKPKPARAGRAPQTSGPRTKSAQLAAELGLKTNIPGRPSAPAARPGAVTPPAPVSKPARSRPGPPGDYPSAPAPSDPFGGDRSPRQGAQPIHTFQPTLAGTGAPATAGPGVQPHLPGMEPSANPGVAAEQPRTQTRSPSRNSLRNAMYDLDPSHPLHPVQFGAMQARSNTVSAIKNLSGAGGFKHVMDFAMGNHLSPYHNALAQHLHRNQQNEE